MEDFIEFVKYIWNEWLIDHIIVILVPFVGFTIGWLLGRDNLTNASAVTVINGIWKAYTVFSAIAFVDWFFHVVWQALKYVAQGLKDWFR
jgi:hypothetical protein